MGLGEGLADGLGLGDALGNGLGDGLGLANGLGDGNADDSATGVPVRGVLRMPGVAACAPVLGAAEGSALGLALGPTLGLAIGEAVGDAAGDAAALACGAGAGEAAGAVEGAPDGVTNGTTDGATAGAVEGFGATVGALVATLVGATAGFAGAVVAVGSARVSTTGVAAVLVGSAAIGSAVAVSAVPIVSGDAPTCRVGVSGLAIMANTAIAMNTRESTVILHFPRLGMCAIPSRPRFLPIVGQSTPTRIPSWGVHMKCRSSGHPTIRHDLMLLAVYSTNYPGDRAGQDKCFRYERLLPCVRRERRAGVGR